MREGAGAGDFDGYIVVLRQGQDIGQVGEGFGRRRRHKGLRQAEVVDDNLGVGVPACQFAQQGQFAGAHHIDGDAGRRAGVKDAAQAGVVGFIGFVCQHYADAHHAGGGRPPGDFVGHGCRAGVKGLDDAEAAGVAGVHLQGVAGIVAVHRVGGDEQGAGHAHGVHCGDHIVAGDFVGAFQVAGPGAFRAVALVGVHLGVDYDGVGGGRGGGGRHRVGSLGTGGRGRAV